MNRRAVVFGLLATPFAACGPDRPRWRTEGEGALIRAAAWAWTQQSDAGAWPSATYGLLRAGHATTAFLLDALLDVPPAVFPIPASQASRALGFLVAQTDAFGALGFAGDPPDYPVYATGLALSAIGKVRPPGWESPAARWRDWLVGQQRRDGFEGTPADGGFPMGSRTPPTPPDPGHIDLSMTRRALEGLVRAGLDVGHPAIVRGRGFVARSQRPSGAFVYSAVEPALNKGDVDPAGAPEGYGSATTDGVLGLLACGAALDDASVQRGVDWLVAAHRLDRNPGVGGGHEAFATAMKGYYRAGAAAVFQRVGRGPGGWQEAMVGALTTEQRPDGSFASTEALQKEDDPLLATGFAIQALSAALA